MVCCLYCCYNARDESGDKVHSSECNAPRPMSDNDEANAQYEFTFGDPARALYPTPAPGPTLPPPVAMPPAAADVTLNATAQPNFDPHGNSVRIGEADVPAPNAGACDASAPTSSAVPARPLDPPSPTAPAPAPAPAHVRQVRPMQTGRYRRATQMERR